MFNKNNLIETVSRRTHVSKKDVTAVLQVALQELQNAFVSENHKQLVILGNAQYVNELLTRAGSRSTKQQRLFSSTNNRYPITR